MRNIQLVDVEDLPRLSLNELLGLKEHWTGIRNITELTLYRTQKNLEQAERWLEGIEAAISTRPRGQQTIELPNE